MPQLTTLNNSGATWEKWEEYGGDLYLFSDYGVDVYDPSSYPWTRIAYVYQASCIAGAVNARGVYLATLVGGVYEVTHANLSGESTSAKTLAFDASSTTPTIQSTNVAGMAGSGNALAIAHAAGLDFLPDSTGSTVYRFTNGAGTRAPAVDSSRLAYELVGSYVHLLTSHPTADWSSPDASVQLGGSAPVQVTADDASGYSTAEGTISASSELSGYYAYDAFYSLTNYRWFSDTGSLPGAWLEFDFTTPTKLASFEFTILQSLGQPQGAPTDFSIEGWDPTAGGGSGAWVELYAETGRTWSTWGPTTTGALSSSDTSTTFDKVRLVVDDVNNAWTYTAIAYFQAFAPGGTALIGSQVNAAAFGTDLFVGTDEGLETWDGTDVATFDSDEVGTVTDVVAVCPSSTATDTSGRCAYGTRNGSDGGRFGILNLSTVSNELTVSGDVRAVYTDDSGSAKAWDRTYGEDVSVQVPTVDFALEAPAPSYYVVKTFQVPTIDFGLEAPAPSIVAGPTTLQVPTIDFALETPAFAVAIDPEEPGVDVYRLTLTGAADGEDDVVLPISSFTARLRSGDPSYLQVVVPDPATYGPEVTARTNGELVLEKGRLFRAGGSQFVEIARVDLETISDDRGASSKSVTLSGHKTATTAVPKTRSLSGLSYRDVGTGQGRYRLARVDWALRPGDFAEIADTSETIEVEVVQFVVGPYREEMEITEVAA